MNELKNTFFAFLDKRKEEITKESELLAKDYRKDESNLLKAKANIYDIFKAIWDAAEKTTADKEAFKEEFLKKAALIPSAWEKSLELAKQHNDTAKIVMEETKLSAVSEIKESFLSLFEEV